MAQTEQEANLPSIPNTEIRNEKNFRNNEIQSRPFQDTLSKPSVDTRPTYGTNVGRAMDRGSLALGLAGAGIQAGITWSKYDEGPDIDAHIENRKELQDAVEAGTISPARASALRRKMIDNAAAAYANNPKQYQKFLAYEKMLSFGSREKTVDLYEQQVEQIASDYYKLYGRQIDPYNQLEVARAETDINNYKAAISQYQYSTAELNSRRNNESNINLDYNQEGYNLLNRTMPMLNTLTEFLSNKIEQGEAIDPQYIQGQLSYIQSYRQEFAQAIGNRYNTESYQAMMKITEGLKNYLTRVNEMPLEEKKRELALIGVNAKIANARDLTPENAMLLYQGTTSADVKERALRFLLNPNNSNSQQRKEDAKAAVDTVASSGSSGALVSFMKLLAGGPTYHPEVMGSMADSFRQNEALYMDAFASFNDVDRRNWMNYQSNVWREANAVLAEQGGRTSNQANGPVPMRDLITISLDDNGCTVGLKEGVQSSELLRTYALNVQQSVNNRIDLYRAMNRINTRKEIMRSSLKNEMSEQLKAFGTVK